MAGVMRSIDLGDLGTDSDGAVEILRQDGKRKIVFNVTYKGC